MSSATGTTPQYVSPLPSGVMMDYAGITAPVGWLMCDGAALSRTTFAALFGAIGTAYGVGDGSTTFNLPDYRGMFARYNDNMSTAAGAAGRDSGRTHGSAQTQTTAKNGLSNAASGVTGSVSGSIGAMNSNASHSHVIGPGSNVSVPSGTFYGVASWNGGGSTTSTNIDHTHNWSGSFSSGLAAAQAITGDAETRPINLSSNRIIKT